MTERPRAVPDWTAWFLLVTLAGFAGYSAWRTIAAGWQPEALAYLGGPALLAAGLAVGASLPARFILLASRALLIVATAALAGGVLGTDKPGFGPLGYPNANAALALQLCALAGIVWASTDGDRGRWHRFVWPALGVVLFLLVVLNRSLAGTLVGAPLLLVALSARVRGLGRSRIVPIAGVLTLGGAVAGFLWLARLPVWAPIFTQAFSAVRRELWTTALQLWAVAPVFGAGPGAFRTVNRLAADADTAPAHSVLLQAGAETGWIGIAILAAVILAGYVLLARSPTGAAAIGAAAWTALWIHSLVDHLTEFWTGPLSAGFVLGVACFRTVPRLPTSTPTPSAAEARTPTDGR